MVSAASFDRRDPYTRTTLPDRGLYFDARWDPPWPYRTVPWQDFGVPDPDLLARELRSVVEDVRAGQTVELGCLGGHGRTGTALACLAVLAGAPAREAVAAIRRDYCARAVETRAQAAFVVDFADRVNG